MGTPSRALATVLAIGCLASCQAVFTFSPLSFLRRDPSTLTADQQLAWAEEALASGDVEAVRDAYDALVVTASMSTDPAVQYTTAQLALELSGVGEVFSSLLGGLTQEGESPFSSAAEALEAVDVGLLTAAADYLDAAQSGGADLTATDYFVGGVGLIVAGAGGEDPLENLEENPNIDRADDFLNAGVAELEEDDPARLLIESFLSSS